MRIFSVAMLLTAAATITSAATLTLSPVLITHEYQQTSNRPCVIGDPSCSGILAETILPTGVDSYDALSPVYTADAIRSIVGNSFMVGVDINQTEVTQTLSLFEMLINGQVVDTYSASPATLVPATVGGGNGTGYADYLLSNFTPLTDLNGTDTVQFHVVMPLVNDGREEFFLISTGDPVTASAVPEPATFALLGAGLMAIGIFRRKK